MNVTELLAELRRIGIVLTVQGHELRYRAPVGAMTGKLKAELTTRKIQIIEALSAGPRPVPPGAEARAYP